MSTTWLFFFLLFWDAQLKKNIIYKVLNTRGWSPWNTHVTRLRSRSRGIENVIIVFIMPALSCFVISPLGPFVVSTHGMDKVYHTSNGCNLSLRFFSEIIEMLGGGYSARLSNDWPQAGFGQSPEVSRGRNNSALLHIVHLVLLPRTDILFWVTPRPRQTEGGEELASRENGTVGTRAWYGWRDGLVSCIWDTVGDVTS